MQSHPKISKGRWHIIQRDPFFATILMDMDPVIDASVTETCATNGDNVFFNPEWLEEANPRLVAACMRKMSLHVALSHPYRRGPFRDIQRWRTACDIAAMCIMQGDKVELPPVTAEQEVQRQMMLSRFTGMIAEEIYNELTNDQDGEGDDQPQDGQDGAQGGAGGAGGLAMGQALDGADMRSPADVAQAQAKNDQRTVRAAMAAKARGNEHALGKELAEQIKSRGVDWRDKLQAFIDARAETILSWSRPNRRFVGQGIYLPGKKSNGIDTLVFVVDTSGSMSNDDLSLCITQIEAAREAIGISRVVVVECDTKVGRVDEFDMTEPLPKEMEFTHRGGTNMNPAFAEAAKHDPSAVICLTDGEFYRDVDINPGAPVLFAVTHNGHQGSLRSPLPHDRVNLPNPAA